MIGTMPVRDHQVDHPLEIGEDAGIAGLQVHLGNRELRLRQRRQHRGQVERVGIRRAVLQLLPRRGRVGVRRHAAAHEVPGAQAVADGVAARRAEVGRRQREAVDAVDALRRQARVHPVGDRLICQRSCRRRSAPTRRAPDRASANRRSTAPGRPSGRCRRREWLWRWPPSRSTPSCQASSYALARAALCAVVGVPVTVIDTVLRRGVVVGGGGRREGRRERLPGADAEHRPARRRIGEASRRRSPSRSTAWRRAACPEAMSAGVAHVMSGVAFSTVIATVAVAEL